jgi:hypothetical protein
MGRRRRRKRKRLGAAAGQVCEITIKTLPAAAGAKNSPTAWQVKGPRGVERGKMSYFSDALREAERACGEQVGAYLRR